MGKKLLDLFAEVGQLKRVSRSGWWTIGVTSPESVADHSFRTAIIAFVIAEEEGCNAERAALIGLFNDLHEARINDLHKVAVRYIDLREAEVKAIEDQLNGLPKKISNKISKIMYELWDDKTLEAIVARDADILECMLQGKEYYSQGWVQAKSFFESSKKLLRTKTAVALADLLETWDPQDWIKKAVILKR